MKNWYKQSKMIDLKDTQNIDIKMPTYVYCEKCKKWATEDPEDENDNATWKAYYEMNPEERLIMDKAYKTFQMGTSKVTSTVCPQCSEIQN